MNTPKPPSRDRALVGGAMVAALILAAAYALKLLTPDYLTPALSQRLLGVILGVTALAYANVIPKALSPYLSERCDPAAEQALRRFAGWVLAVGAAGYVAAWLVVPLPYAMIVAVASLATAVLVVIVRILLGTSRTPRRPRA